MRTLFLAVAMSATIFATGVTRAAAGDYRYCLQGEEYGGAGNCSFTSYQQCQATASGLTAYCGANSGFTNVAILTNRARPRPSLVRFSTPAKTRHALADRPAG